MLDLDTLATAGLTLSSVSPDVLSPSDLGVDSVAFGINPRDAATLQTTFLFSGGSLAPFSGTIEHSGSVFFNGDSVQVGDFTIGYDAARDDGASGGSSGFFVASNAGVMAPIFDVEDPSSLSATSSALIVSANLLVFPELAGVLGNSGLEGVDVGNAQIAAVAVPEPTAGGLAIVFLRLMGLLTRAHGRNRTTS